MTLDINSLGADRLTHAHISTHDPKQFQETTHTLAFGWHVPGPKKFIHNFLNYSLQC